MSANFDSTASPVIVIGTGGHARVVGSILLAKGAVLVGFLDERTPNEEEQILGKSVLGGLDYLNEIDEGEVSLALAVGDNSRRCQLLDELSSKYFGLQIINAVHPTARIEQGVTLGKAVTVCVGSIVCVNASIEDGVIVNTGAIVDHECKIGRCSHISPGANLAGKVDVGKLTHIGIGASVIERVKIGENSRVGAGSVVIDDIPNNATAVGCPARIL